jgi:hypothetical protein
LIHRPLFHIVQVGLVRILLFSIAARSFSLFFNRIKYV